MKKATYFYNNDPLKTLRALDKKFGLNLKKSSQRTIIKLFYGPIRSECSSCRVLPCILHVGGE